MLYSLLRLQLWHNSSHRPHISQRWRSCTLHASSSLTANSGIVPNSHFCSRLGGGTTWNSLLGWTCTVNFLQACSRGFFLIPRMILERQLLEKVLLMERRVMRWTMHICRVTQVFPWADKPFLIQYAEIGLASLGLMNLNCIGISGMPVIYSNKQILKNILYLIHILTWLPNSYNWDIMPDFWFWCQFSKLL